MAKGSDKNDISRPCVADLGSRPVEICFKITLQGAKNGRGRPRVKVTIEEQPKLKRRSKLAG